VGGEKKISWTVSGVRDRLAAARLKGVGGSPEKRGKKSGLRDNINTRMNAGVIVKLTFE